MNAASRAAAPPARPGGATLIMGVVNVTTDSFSDGGRYLDLDAALAHARELVAEGAAVVDVGGESTRPGAHRVPAEVERDRVVPVITALAAEGIAVSVDTMRASVAAAALDAGAAIVNDVSGGRADPAMAGVVAGSSAPWILMHWRPSPGAPGADTWSGIHHGVTDYTDVVTEVRDELLHQADAAIAAGIAPERIVLDPGLGFAKNGDHNWALLRGLNTLQDTGFRVLVGASRKRFLGELLGGRAPAGREVATAAISALAAREGVWGVRVHDVRATADAIAVARAWKKGGI
ncbi:Dihydropteroate synthase OS=Tsukamurella paurometabola (strain ATCC 8368 / DSM / CCUG 35730/ CIP 100753 / JCM 10117 / KCTC 9821 / NBRC 16120 / NCIMB 702349/ NCTC 13040) OX=521096 GN=Tpau_0561 PE=3 SV=1 [Tsukamurella paurometabola]|uniref:Dihydropteroate synthase n=2 Tax=Tsukamurella paurometabola TaxID=2061 RepID=D5USD4_TSUPD|nr:dihydropteroate synthase [Tsukamurella paurometabola DSM 20162]SUP43139.1 Dihydropteroate synthase 1 [Tsukamurella paurometabola]